MYVQRMTGHSTATREPPVQSAAAGTVTGSRLGAAIVQLAL